MVNIVATEESTVQANLLRVHKKVLVTFRNVVKQTMVIELDFAKACISFYTAEYPSESLSLYPATIQHIIRSLKTIGEKNREKTLKSHKFLPRRQQGRNEQ